MQTRRSYRPRQILCPMDMSDLSDLALKYAHIGARLFDATLTVLHAMHVDIPRYLSKEVTARILAELNDAKAAGRHDLENYVRHVLGDAEYNSIRVRCQVADVAPVEAVTRALAESRVDLVVMGTHGYSGVKHWMLGSVTESVLHRAAVPVFTVRQKVNDFIDTTRPEVTPRIGRILCPCNATTAAGHALQVAASLADRFEARLTVLWSREPGAEANGEDLAAWIRATLIEPPEIDVIERSGKAADQAIELADELECDLIVIGARRQPLGQGTAMGRTTELVLRHAGVPVLAVPCRDETPE